MTPEALSKELRTGSGALLARRRGVVFLSAVASGSMLYISLYQMGILPHLADPPLPYFHSDAVDAAPEAYKYLSAPDALLGLNSYAATALLAAMGGANRERTQPWLALALGGKLIFDVVNATRLTLDQWTKHRAFCVWCLLASASTFASVPLALPELRAAWRAVRG